MRKVALNTRQPDLNSAPDSYGLSITPLANSNDLFISLVHLDAGGQIGLHQAVVRQLFVVIEGDAIVTGAEAAEQVLAAREAVVWEAGEMHKTRSQSGLTAIVMEGAASPIT
jgi:quercetin dioxygenase-like cupin family protein